LIPGPKQEKKGASMEETRDFPKTIRDFREDDYLPSTKNLADVADGTPIATYELVSTGTVSFPPPMIENVKMVKGE
jgi:hypothetical protein